jgi:hypothetical protein
MEPALKCTRRAGHPGRPKALREDRMSLITSPTSDQYIEPPRAPPPPSNRV